MLALFNTQSKLHRVSASVICFMWIAGFVFCQTQCLVGSTEACHSEQNADHTNDQPKLPCHGSPSDSDSEGAMNCCCNVDVSNPTLDKVESALPSEWLLVALITYDRDAGREIENNHANYFHKTPWLEWSLTPEMRLGPAVYSLAPPQTLIA